MAGWGLLWQVAGGRTLLEEIAAAAARYEEKFGCPVGMVLVHPAQDDGTRRWGNAEVRLGAKPHGHLFLSQAQAQEAEAGKPSHKIENRRQDVHI